MPEGSVDLDKQVLCWRAKIHIFVIIAVHVVAAVAIIATASIEYAVANSDNKEKAEKQGTDYAKVGAELKNGFGAVVLILLLIPGVAQCIQGAVASLMLCCRSKCCFGYCSIVTLLAVAFTAVSTGQAFAGAPILTFGVAVFTGNMFKASFLLIGIVGIVALINQVYCVALLCKLSYFDRSDTGVDLYQVEDGNTK